MAELIQPEQIEQAILLIRSQRVMLDRDLAALYGVETKNRSRITTPASAPCSTPFASLLLRRQGRAGKSDSTSRKTAYRTA